MKDIDEALQVTPLDDLPLDDYAGCDDELFHDVTGGDADSDYCRRSVAADADLDDERRKKLERELFRMDDLLAKTADEALYLELRQRRDRIVAAIKKLRPTITIRSAELDLLVDEAEAVLASMYTDSLYQRGGWLIRVLMDEQLVKPRIATLRKAQTRGLLARAARWERMAPTKDDPDRAVRVFPPKDVSEVLHDQGEWPRIRVLDTLLMAPTIRPDGTVLDKTGYDPATRSLLFADGTSWLPVAEKPTKADAMAALAKLRDVLSEFPFRNKDNIAPVGQDESVALALILTGLTRTAYPLAPMFVVTGHTPGSGKGLIVRVAHAIATGRRSIGGGSEVDDKELEKRITTAAREGDSWFLVDDVKEPLGGASLDNALTSLTWKGRVLRASESVEAIIRFVWVVTGNNVLVKNDLVRRAVRCYIASPVERPEARNDFRFRSEEEFIDHVVEHRVELVHAALTIVRAYIAAGSPNVVERAMGSFGGWSAMVRQPLVWLGCADPRMTQDELGEEADGQRDHLEQLLYSWYGLFHDNERTIHDALRAIGGHEDKDSSNGSFEVGLRDAFFALSRGKLDAVSIGNALKSVKDRPVAGLRLKNCGKCRSGILWKTEVLKGQREAVNLRMATLDKKAVPAATQKQDVGKAEAWSGF